jgi:uncharacterized protein involved in exopolysaccharide biosynthesis
MTPDTLEVSEDRDALAARLATVERAYGELLERVRRFERERAEIRRRLQRLLARIDSDGAH